MYDPAAAHAFLSRLTVPAGQYLEIRLIVPDERGAVQRFVPTVAEALEVVAGAVERSNVYVGACPRSRRSGKRDAIATVIGAWADLDFHQIAPSREIAFQRAIERVSALDTEPTLLIHTGNGLQAWWLFERPTDIGAHWPAKRFESINRGLAERLGGDAVHDLARVLRVPGTTNLPDAKKRARGCVPVMAHLLEADGPLYHPDQFAHLAVAVPHRAARSPVPLSIQALEVSAPEVVEAFGTLVEQLGEHHPLSRTWSGRRRLSDGSRSSFDMALACQMAKMKVRRELAALVLRNNPHGKGDEASLDYINRTITRAYEKYAIRHAN